jgi:hypothetical protein
VEQEQRRPLAADAHMQAFAVVGDEGFHGG